MYVQYGFLHVILTRPKLTVHTRGLTWDLGRDNRDLRHLLSIPENMHCKRNKVSRSTIKTRDNKTVFIFKINSLARALHNSFILFYFWCEFSIIKIKMQKVTVKLVSNLPSSLLANYSLRKEFTLYSIHNSIPKCDRSLTFSWATPANDFFDRKKPWTY